MLDLLMEAGMSAGDPLLPAFLNLKTASGGQICLFDKFVKDNIKQVSCELLEELALTREDFSDTTQTAMKRCLVSKGGVMITTGNEAKNRAPGLLLKPGASAGLFALPQQ